MIRVTVDVFCDHEDCNGWMVGAYSNDSNTPTSVLTTVATTAATKDGWQITDAGHLCPAHAQRAYLGTISGFQ